MSDSFDLRSATRSAVINIRPDGSSLCPSITLCVNPMPFGGSFREVGVFTRPLPKHDIVNRSEYCACLQNQMRPRPDLAWRLRKPFSMIDSIFSRADPWNR